MALDSRIPKLCVDADRKAGEAVERAGRAIEQGAKARARVDTGEMRERLEWQPGPGLHEGQVIAGAPHSKFNEYGTRHMSAQPMLRPATEDAREPFYRDMRDCYRVT